MSKKEAGTDRLQIDNMYLCGSEFSRVNLKGTTFQDAVMTEMRLDDVNVAGTVFDNANMSGMVLHNVTLEGTKIDFANLKGLAITNADLTGMTIDGILVSDLLQKWDQG